LFIFKHEPVNYLISAHKDEEAIKLIKMLYQKPECEEHYLKFVIQERAKTSAGVSSVSLKEAITSPLYQRATLACFFLNCFN